MDIFWLVFVLVFLLAVIIVFYKLLISFFKDDKSALGYVSIASALFIFIALVDNYSTLFNLDTELKNTVGFFKDVFGAIEIPLVLLIITDKIKKSQNNE